MSYIESGSAPHLISQASFQRTFCFVTLFPHWNQFVWFTGECFPSYASPWLALTPRKSTTWSSTWFLQTTTGTSTTTPSGRSLAKPNRSSPLVYSFTPTRQARAHSGLVKWCLSTRWSWPTVIWINSAMYVLCICLRDKTARINPLPLPFVFYTVNTRSLKICLRRRIRLLDYSSRWDQMDIHMFYKSHPFHLRVQL